MKRRKLKNVKKQVQDYQRGLELVDGSIDEAQLLLAADQLDPMICDDVSSLLWENFYEPPAARWRSA